MVFNETNTKHTFKVDNPNDTSNTVTNIIVVENESDIYEYFLKYNFNGGIPYNTDGTVDLSRFTGTIDAYDSAGQRKGGISTSNGEVIDNDGQTTPCPEDTPPPPDNEDDDNDDNQNGGGAQGNIGDGSPDDGDDDNQGGGGWFDGGPDWQPPTCGLNYYGNTGTSCNRNNSSIHEPINNNGVYCTGFAGEGILVVTDCNGNVLASGRQMASTGEENTVNPCGGNTGVLLKPINHKKHCIELKKLAENAAIKASIEYMQDKADDISIKREYGFSYSEDADPLEADIVPGNDGRKLDIPVGGTIYGHGHTHPFEDQMDEKVFPMFSFEDIVRFQVLTDEHDGQVNQALVDKAFSILTIKQESNTVNYVIKIENYNEFINYFNINFAGLTPDERKKKVNKKNLKLKNKYKRLWKRFSTNDAEKYLAALFKFMEAEGFNGLSIYRNTDNTLLNWERMDYNPSNTDSPIIKTPCNN